MSDHITAFVALGVGAITAATAFGTQWISGHFSLRTKHLELLYARKADAYAEFIGQCCTFVTTSDDFGAFTAFQASLHRALIVASKEVADLLDLDPRVSIHVEAIRLRQAETDDDRMAIKVQGWHDKMGRLIAAMRDDLERLEVNRR